jgi:hypothetical protein
VLGALRNGDVKSTSQNSGDTTYDIDINVESIANETDLDMISNYIEQKIVASASYRNNNLASRSR